MAKKLIKQSELVYIGMMDGRHAWQLDSDYFFWTKGDNKVTTDLHGSFLFCVVSLPGQVGSRVIKPLTKADAKRAIVAKLNQI